MSKKYTADKIITVDIDSTNLGTFQDLTVQGNLTVSGDTFSADVQTVNIEDNLLLINNGETGAGVTAGTSGIEVDRGTATNYQFLFDESDDMFKVGESNDLEIVATRPWSDGKFLLNTTDTLTGDLTVTENIAATNFIGNFNGYSDYARLGSQNTFTQNQKIQSRLDIEHNATDATDLVNYPYHLELYSTDTLDSGNYISLLFHHQARTAGAIRFNVNGFHFHSGNSSILRNLYFGTANAEVGNFSSTVTTGINITNEVRTNNGNYLVLNAGESHSYATGQTGENIYLNVENGLVINSSPDNWATGWVNRNIAIINDSNGNSSFSGNVTATNFIGNGSQLTNVDADTLDSLDSAQFLRDDTQYVEITVDGDADTYYPVGLDGSGEFKFGTYSISRRYNWTAPDTWNTSTHRGGLTFTFRWSGDSAWGGNDKTIRVEQFQESYSTMVAGMALATSGGPLIVWLRGGGARYRIATPSGTSQSPEIHLSGFTDTNSTAYPVRTDVSNVSSEIHSKFPVRNSSAIYDDGNRVVKATNTVELTGDVTGSGSFNQYGDISFSTAINGANHTHDNYLLNSGIETFSGNLTFNATDVSGNYATTAIELREVNNVTTSQTGHDYAPALSFHWGGRMQGKLWMNNIDGLNTLTYSSGGGSGSYPTTNMSIKTGTFVADENVIIKGAATSTDSLLKLYNTTNGSGSGIEFSDHNTQLQKGFLNFYHGDTVIGGTSYGVHWKFTTDQANLAIHIPSNGGYYVGENKVFHEGNLTNVSQLNNDAGYLTSETDSQTLSFDANNGNLLISGGNTIDTLDDRYMHFVLSTGSDWNTTTYKNGIYRMTGSLNNPFGGSHATLLNVSQSNSQYGFQLVSNNGTGLKYRGFGTTQDTTWYDVYNSGNFIAGTDYNSIIGTDTDINTSGATIIDNIYVTDGVITSMGTRNLTASDIGALPTSTSSLNIRDARDDGDKTPNDYTDKTVLFEFTDDVASSTSTWDSVITMKGWDDNYRVWQLMSHSSSSGADSNLYYRTGSGTTWGARQKVYTDGNFIDGTDYDNYGSFNFVVSGSSNTISSGNNVSLSSSDSKLTISNPAGGVASFTVNESQINFNNLLNAPTMSGYALKHSPEMYTRQQWFQTNVLTDGANISINFDTDQVSYVSLGGNRTIDNPTNVQSGAIYVMAIQQDGTGSRTVTWGTNYEFGDDGEPTLSTGASKTDVLTFMGDASGRAYFLGIKKGFDNYLPESIPV